MSASNVAQGVADPTWRLSSTSGATSSGRTGGQPSMS